MESRSRAFHAFPPAEAAARTWTTPMPKWTVPLHTRPGLTRLGNVAATPCPPPVPAYILPHLDGGRKATQCNGCGARPTAFPPVSCAGRHVGHPYGPNPCGGSLG